MTSYPNYENTIEEHDETGANDDSDSGIDSLYECIKFKTNENRQKLTTPGPNFYWTNYFPLLAAGLYQDNKVTFLLEHTLSLSPFILPPSELVNIWSCEHTAAP